MGSILPPLTNRHYQSSLFLTTHVPSHVIVSKAFMLPNGEIHLKSSSLTMRVMMIL